MIDDDTLAAHVRAALDGIEVPAEGPERVLAARDLLVGTGKPSGEPEPPEAAGLPTGSAGLPTGSAGRPSGSAPVPSRRPRLPIASRWVLGSAAALVAVVLVAVVALAGGRGASTTSSKTSGPFDRPASGLVNGPLMPAGPISAPAAPSQTPGLNSKATPIQTPTPAPAGQTPDRVIQTGSLILTVGAGHVDATVAALGDRASGAGGQVAKSQTDESPSGPSADLTLKVPAGNFTALLSAVRSLGSATSVNTSAVDVTATYVDLTARLNALEATRAQFLQILAKAQSIGDILAVEAQITPVQTQIEQLQGQQQVLDDQTSFATLDVHVAVPAAPAPVARPAGGLSGAWAHARHAFASGIESIVSSLGGIAVFLVCVAVLVGLARITWAVIRRRLV